MRDMLGRGGAVSVDEALGLISDNLPHKNISDIRIPLHEAFGRILAENIVSPEDLPGFSRSTVDGYAVASSDTFGASETSPGYLNVAGEILMGQEPQFGLEKGEAAKIATGGMLPEGADAVLMFEHTQAHGGQTIEAQKALAPGENVIQRGEDVRAGEVVLKRGRRLRPHDIAVIAGVGYRDVCVFERPTVSIISTGDEVVSEGEPLKPGQVRDMNSFILAGLVGEDGGTPLRKGIVSDDESSLRSAVEAALRDSDIVLISGGSSVGTKDMTERVIGGLGKVLFHSVAMKPGKPMLAGIAEGKLVLGLPGHPRAVAICYEVFIRHTIERMSGLSHEPVSRIKRTLKARLSKSVSSVLGRREVISVVIEERDGESWAEPLLGKSGLLGMMVRAGGTITVPEGKPGLKGGQLVDVRLI